MADEIRCFWTSRITGAAVLFWLNKYLTISFLVLSQSVLYLPISKEVRVLASTIL